MTQVDPAKLIFAGAAALFLGAAALAQAPAASPPPAPKPPTFKNLKIFPPEIPRDRLIAIMKGYTVSLGVKCTFCHVGEEGKRETMDFASDANKHKDIARTMMAMARRLNEQDFAVKDLTKLKVTCYTCHRGAPQPLTAAPEPEAPPATPHH
ncbi:MAG: c-type cytochrome [Sphingomicrobium sp.]